MTRIPNANVRWHNRHLIAALARYREAPGARSELSCANDLLRRLLLWETNELSEISPAYIGNYMKMNSWRAVRETMQLIDNPTAAEVMKLYLAQKRGSW